MVLYVFSKCQHNHHASFLFATYAQRKECWCPKYTHFADEKTGQEREIKVKFTYLVRN